MLQLEVFIHTHMNLKLFPNLLPAEKNRFWNKMLRGVINRGALIFNDPYYQYDNFKSRTTINTTEYRFYRSVSDDLVKRTNENHLIPII